MILNLRFIYFDPATTERRARMSVVQTHSTQTHNVSYEGLDTREQIQLGSVQTRSVKRLHQRFGSRYKIEDN